MTRKLIRMMPAWLACAGTASAGLITPVSVSPSSEISVVDRLAGNTVDSSGLSGTGATTDTHGNNANDMWLTRGAVFSPQDLDPALTFDLGGLHDLTTIRIWNFNEAGYTRHGANQIAVAAGATPGDLSQTLTLQVTQAGGTAAEPAQDFACGFTGVRYVRFTIVSNHDGDDFANDVFVGTAEHFAGLSEVRFEGVPTPGGSAANPLPANGAVQVEPGATLEWDANDPGATATGWELTIGVGDISYNYVVHTETLSRGLAEQESHTLPANIIQTGGPYWWRVDKLTPSGVVPGPVWTFTTRDETAAENDTRMAWFREGKLFGAIVWGLYSGAEGVWPAQIGTKNPSWTYAEWIQFWTGLDTLTYRDTLEPYLTGEFFDAAQMARMCKDAGMEMVYVMPRHHDGYAIWDTQTTTLLAPDGFKIGNSPYNPTNRDYLKELVDALRAEGLKVGFYFSLGDWHHPDFPHDGTSWAHPTPGVANPPGHTEVWQNYVDYLYQQVTEIVDPAVGADYGPFDVVYFDYSSNGINGEDWGASRLVHLVRKHHPDIIINNRLWLGLDNPNGDYATPEADVNNVGYNDYPDRDWEAIMSANQPPTWGYGRPDLYPFKSATDLVWDVVDVASKGGLIELSVSPKADGSLHPDQLAQYAGLGAWMAANGGSIKGTTGNPVGVRPPWGEYTSKRGEQRLFMHVFDRPADGIVVASGLYGTAANAWLLTDPSQALAVTPRADGFQVELPAGLADPINTVIVVDYDFPEVPASSTVVAAVSSENVLGLDRDADHAVDGSGLGVGPGGSLVHTSGEDGVAWTTAGSLGSASDYQPFIVFDLGMVSDVATIREWGYNDDFDLGGGNIISIIGPDEVDVFTSVDGVNFDFEETVRFALAPGTADYAGHAIPVDYRGVRYIRLEIRTNHDGAVFDGSGTNGGAIDGRFLTGLSEIRFEGPVVSSGPGLAVDAVRFQGGAFEADVSGLTPGASYRLMRGANLADGFPTVVDGPRSATSVTMTFSDPSPPVGRAFYRVESAP